MTLSFNGSGTFVINSTGQPVVSGTVISSTVFNALTADLATGLTDCVTKDGQSTTTALIPFALGLKTDILSPYTANGPVALTAGQLGFPATQNPSSDVNTLDDYEEGTFTPTLAFGGASTGINYVTQTGTYTKIGNRVFFEVALIISNKGSSTGAATMGGLPFTSANIGATGRPVSLFMDNMAVGVTGPVARVNANATTITFYNFSAGSIAGQSEASFNNNSAIYISGHYGT